MKIRDFAMIGVGMMSTLLYQKYLSCYVNDAFDLMAKEVDIVKDEISQMMK